MIVHPREAPRWFPDPESQTLRGSMGAGEGGDFHLDKRAEPISWIQAIRDKRSLFNLFHFSLRSYRVCIPV